MRTKPKTARAVLPNKGVEIKYRKALQSLIDEMHKSYLYWVTAGYRKTPPRMVSIVGDASPSDEMQKRLDELARRWIEKFEDSAPIIAETYLRSMFKATDQSFKQALKDAGWSVEFRMTAVMRDAFDASLQANIELIKSIPQKYSDQLQGIVMRSYTTGRDLQSMVKDIKALYPQAADRAVLIARDQSNKANAAVNRARQLELGITEALWLHSGAGKHPRPDHVAANGKRFEIAKGCLISGKYILPGEEINCRCSSRAILPI